MRMLRVSVCVGRVAHTHCQTRRAELPEGAPGRISPFYMPCNISLPRMGSPGLSRVRIDSTPEVRLRASRSSQAVKALAKGAKNPAKERQAPSNASDADLLAALTRLVHRASVNGATGLRARLECLVMHAGEGKTLRSNRAERRKRAREKKRQTFMVPAQPLHLWSLPVLPLLLAALLGTDSPMAGKCPGPPRPLATVREKG